MVEYRTRSWSFDPYEPITALDSREHHPVALDAYMDQVAIPVPMDDRIEVGRIDFSGCPGIGEGILDRLLDRLLRIRLVEVRHRVEQVSLGENITRPGSIDEEDHTHRDERANDRER
jgi:hypothetical protein